jgi:hypothetical protein
MVEWYVLLFLYSLFDNPINTYIHKQVIYLMYSMCPLIVIIAQYRRDKCGTLLFLPSLLPLFSLLLGFNITITGR